MTLIGENDQLLARLTVCVELACWPHVCVGFLGVLWFSPHPKDVHLR